ncbi:hypothetical protein Tco_0661562, partial [Tanacetum coccineum]
HQEVSIEAGTEASIKATIEVTAEVAAEVAAEPVLPMQTVAERLEEHEVVIQEMYDHILEPPSKGLRRSRR